MSQRQFDFSKPDVDSGGGAHPTRRATYKPAGHQLTAVPGKPGFFVNAKGQLTYEPNQNPQHYPKASK